MVFMTFKNRIQHIILTHCNRSNKVFADRINIATSTIQSWDDEHFPKGDILHRIHKEFNIDINWLLTGEGEPYIKTDREEIDLPGIITESSVEYQVGAPALGHAVDMLAKVLESGNQVFIQAVMSSLIASSHAVNAAKQQSQQISDLRFEFDVVCRRLAALEKRLEKESDLGKQETVEKKAM